MKHSLEVGDKHTIYDARPEREGYKDQYGLWHPAWIIKDIQRIKIIDVEWRQGTGYDDHYKFYCLTGLTSNHKEIFTRDMTFQDLWCRQSNKNLYWGEHLYPEPLLTALNGEIFTPNPERN